MTFPRFFIDRPIFAIVLSVLMMIGGIVSFFQLPLSEYPAVTPPTVNRKMKPTAHSIGALKSIEPPHIVAIHEKIFTPVGTAMTMVAATK